MSCGVHARTRALRAHNTRRGENGRGAGGGQGKEGGLREKTSNRLGAFRNKADTKPNE